MKELLNKLGYGEEDIKKISKGMKDGKIYTSSEENIDERYAKLKGQKGDIEEELKAANSTISELKKNNSNNEELQAKITQYEGDIKTLKEESEKNVRNLLLDNALTNALRDNKAKYVDLLLAKIDRDKLTVKDGTVDGIDTQIKELKTNYKDLFEQELKGVPPYNGDIKTTTGNNSYESLLQNADKMTAEEVAKAFSKLK